MFVEIEMFFDWMELYVLILGLVIGFYLEFRILQCRRGWFCKIVVGVFLVVICDMILKGKDIMDVIIFYNGVDIRKKFFLKQNELSCVYLFENFV